MSGMSDRQRIIEMLDRAGVVWREGTVWLQGDDAPATAIVIEARTGPHNLGYYGFLSQLEFDENGNLTDWASWE